MRSRPLSQIPCACIRSGPQAPGSQREARRRAPRWGLPKHTPLRFVRTTLPRSLPGRAARVMCTCTVAQHVRFSGFERDACTHTAWATSRNPHGPRCRRLVVRTPVARCSWTRIVILVLILVLRRRRRTQAALPRCGAMRNCLVFVQLRIARQIR
jgi:hypothetical protein